MIKERLQNHLFLSEYLMHTPHLSLDLISNIAMNVIGTKRVHDILKFPNLHQETLNPFRNVVQRVLNQSLSDDKVEHIQMDNGELIDVFIF